MLVRNTFHSKKTRDSHCPRDTRQQEGFREKQPSQASAAGPKRRCAQRFPFGGQTCPREEKIRKIGAREKQQQKRRRLKQRK